MKRLIGEWIGTGKTTLGKEQGSITEYLRVEVTDNKSRFSYVRRSRIRMSKGELLHDEIGYLGDDKISLLLSRDSYVKLKWDDKRGLYVQEAPKPPVDTKNMTRQIILPKTPAKQTMIWDVSMEVKMGGTRWVTHTVYTEFERISGFQFPSPLRKKKGKH